ncbi:B68 [Gallid alphaherpesvirus 2]|nr:B68 [Gallid alphaherpesvirus 2]UOW60822.1 B68 [Gallid alphaherpesvirus 2]UOW63112.1 B68 [Gallid alphaherpesvirus 2]UOW63203.1 B68 [Gallid alphaherpesvirus 2]
MMKRFVGQSRRSGTADHRQHRPGMSLLGIPMGVVSVWSHLLMLWSFIGGMSDAAGSCNVERMG